jgi:soluble lytic murein transglycosylase
MAYEYDQMGNIVGEYESDEERRRRLAAEAAQQPVKQTITYKPDGTQEMTIRGTPEALSPMNPNTPTVSGPVAPDETFRRMQQIESGNRDFDAQGRPVTSPAGAMFRNQVMPATAANPGYGIRPAQAQTPEEYNRVGKEYYQAMLKKFGGNQQAAAAAYNAGPGRVQKNMQANAGQMNTQQLPRETQGYLQKLGQMAGNMIPSAQAGTVPQPMPQGQNARDDLMMRAQVPAPQAQMPQAQVPQPDSVINNQVAQYEQRPRTFADYALGMTPGKSAELPPDPFQQYLSLQDNPRDLVNYGYDPTVPKALQDRARDRAAELINQERGMTAAKNQIPNMSETDIAKALRDKTTGGNYLKAALFAVLGMENSAMAEAARLGIGKETMSQLNGEPVMIKIAANGTPIEGYNAATGKKLSASELIAAAQGGGTLGKGASLSAEVYVDPATGNRYKSGYDNSGRVALVNIQGGAPFKGDPKSLTLQSIGTAQARADIGLITELKKKHGTNVLDAEKDYVALNGPFKSTGDRAEFRQAYGFDLAQPGGAAGAGGAAPGATTTPGATAAPAGANVNVPLAQQQRQAQGQKDIVTEAAKQVAASADTQNMLKDINKVTGLLDSGNHNIGSIGSTIVGRGRIAQALGEIGETDDAANTRTIMDTVTKLAADGLKALGSNPSTVDLEFWTKYKPDATSNPKFVRDWIQSRSDDLKRRLGYAGAQVGAGGGAGVAPAAPAAANSQFRIISVEPGPR